MVQLEREKRRTFTEKASVKGTIRERLSDGYSDTEGKVRGTTREKERKTRLGRLVTL